MARGTTKLLWRGLDRGRLRSLLRSLKMLEDRDLRMSVADFAGVDAIIYYFVEEANDETDLAIQLLKNRCNTLLAQRY